MVNEWLLLLLLLSSDDLLVPFDDVMRPKPEPTRFAKEPAFVPPEARESNAEQAQSLAAPAADVEAAENGASAKEYNFGSVNVDDDGNIDDGKEDSGPFM